MRVAELVAVSLSIFRKRPDAHRRAPLLEPLESRQFLSTYYLSPTGHDNAAGTSTASAWRTIDRVNTAKLKAGDRVLFAAGKSFTGSLYVPSAEGGTKSNPVMFSTYGSGGRATIHSGGKPGVDIAQTAGVSISNLKFVGGGMKTNRTPGIWVHIDWSNRKMSGLTVSNVEVSGYGRDGLKVLAAGAGSAVNDIRVERSSFHDNLYGGVTITGSPRSISRNIVIDHVKTYNIPGSRAASGVTGNGIFVADVENVLVQRCVSYNNGKDGKAPVGIWAAGANRVTFQYNESYNNHTATITDGGGFDFDWDVHNSVMQYNYSHNNDGPGYILATGSHKSSGNTIRYNVSENDGRKNGRAAIQIWGAVENASIYNNTVYMGPTNNGNSAAVFIHNVNAGGKLPANVTFRNNIFYVEGIKLLNITNEVATKAKGLKFEGNAYYSGASKFKLQWGNKVYSNLKQFRKGQNQERLNGIAVGYQGHPRLRGAGKGGTIGDADKLSSLTAYRLQTKSPLVNHGVSQPSTLSAVTKDFFGEASRKGSKHDMGVDELR